jgi:molybdopterin converting factor small subunit
MQIRIVYHDTVQNFTGKQVEMLNLDESATAASLLSRLGATHPESLSQLSSFQLCRGGQAITADAFLADGDIIDISLSDTALA